MEGVLGEEIVNLVLKFGEHGAWDLSNELIKLGTVLESDTSNALLTGLARQDNFNRMNGLMAKMVEMDIQPNVVTFGILIYHTCKFRRVDAALEVLEKMSGVESVVVIYNTLIDGLCKIGSLLNAMEFFNEILTSGCSPDAIVYYNMISGFSQDGRTDGGSFVKEVGFRPDTVCSDVFDWRVLLEEQV
ncbi:hypothetical protein NC653_006691 [Populus alba x Populus x berolinensis]|uniref:Pentatricopeptide repeat-containing protein n=1 Tax=Populus alba x Populus x berolinensis TaxID=444605 RepID=A0AAD6REV0_9ROSI|nr:hypothetical protein NC653_006691 [Populus alba x Populus x berolinensis]